MKNKHKNKNKELVEQIKFEAKETRRIFGREKTIVEKVIKTIFIVMLLYICFLLPYTMLAASNIFMAYTLYIGLFLGISIYSLVKNKKNKIKLNISEIPNVTSISITYVLLFISILTLIPDIFSYYAQAYYLSIYEYLLTPVYLTLTCLFMPTIETFFLRKLITKTENDKLKILIVIINTLLIYLIQPYFIYGLFFAIPSLVLNIYTMKTNNIFNSCIYQIIFNFVFAISLLYLSKIKLALLIIYVIILLITLIINIYKIALDKINTNKKL